MRIAIVTAGTRGDVQPYAAIAQALARRGHQVTLSTHAEYAPLLRAHGVTPGAPIRGNFREMMESDLGRKWFASADSPRKYAKYARELFVPMQSDWCEDVGTAVEGADAVLFYVLGTGALHVAQKRKIPAIALAPWPMVPTREAPPLPAPWLHAFPGFVKRWAGHRVLEMAFGAFTEVHNAYRARLGLAPFREKDIVHFAIESGIPCLHLFSEHVLARPRDWEDRHEVVGFPFLEPLPHTPAPALAAFLEAGPPPVYIGFGSMTGFAPEQLAKLVGDAVKRAGVRAVVARGWLGLSPERRDDIHVIDEVPHDWLFPRMSAVVHHGGVGTFHEGLRAGKPTVIAAFFGDQTFWGWLNHRIGSGPRALARGKLTAEGLAQAIRTAIDVHSTRAAEIGAKLREENGATRAAERIERLLG
ncbi:MAG: glycosyltransferase [Polyangiales bacterium]